MQKKKKVHVTFTKGRLHHLESTTRSEIDPVCMSEMSEWTRPNVAITADKCLISLWKINKCCLIGLPCIE